MGFQVLTTDMWQEIIRSRRYSEERSALIKWEWNIQSGKLCSTFNPFCSWLRHIPFPKNSTMKTSRVAALPSRLERNWAVFWKAALIWTSSRPLFLQLALCPVSSRAFHRSRIVLEVWKRRIEKPKIYWGVFYQTIYVAWYPFIVWDNDNA